jgi:hypothetical protein
MPELRTKYWKCENIRSMASVHNYSVGNECGINASNFKNEEKIICWEERRKKTVMNSDFIIIIMQLI